MEDTWGGMYREDLEVYGKESKLSIVLLKYTIFVTKMLFLIRYLRWFCLSDIVSKIMFVIIHFCRFFSLIIDETTYLPRIAVHHRIITIINYQNYGRTPALLLLSRKCCTHIKKKKQMFVVSIILYTITLIQCLLLFRLVLLFHLATGVTWCIILKLGVYIYYVFIYFNILPSIWY